MSDIDSDDESDPFMMFRGPPILNIRCMDEHPDDCAEVVVVDDISEPSFCAIVDDLFLRKDISGLEALLNDSNMDSTQALTHKDLSPKRYHDLLQLQWL